MFITMQGVFEISNNNMTKIYNIFSILIVFTALISCNKDVDVWIIDNSYTISS